LIEQIKKLIAAEKGEIIDIKDWGKRELAYEIWVHQSWADNPRIEFNKWLEQELKEK
jgi:ribosomal protein S6